jgi:hypothetical protein
LRLAALLLAVLPSAAPALVWEKLVAPGVSYRMEVDYKVPRIVHALRLFRGAPEVRARPALGDGVVYVNEADKGREGLSGIVDRYHALGGVNADFFPFTGDPLGAMVLDGELISLPRPGRSAFCWGPGGSTVARLNWDGTVTSRERNLRLDGLNQECGVNEIVVATEVAGLSLAKPPCLQAVVRTGQARWPVNASVSGTLEYVSESDMLAVEPGTAVLSARGTAIQYLRELQRGDPVTVRYRTGGVDWAKFDNVVGGGPQLLSKGRERIPWDSEGFTPSLATARHPRTAVGSTASGDIWFVTVDGRQGISDGATLDELATVMGRLGCVEAVNLDGGGSTTFHLRDLTLNRPSDGQERKVANAVVWFAPLGTPVSGDTVVQGPAEVTIGRAFQYTLIGPDGQRLPHAEVLWACSGDAWIDQGGALRALRSGSATVRAAHGGKLASVTVRVVAPPAEAAAKP